MAAVTVQSVPVDIQFVHSRIVRYYPSLIDLRWCQAIHSCDVCPMLNEAKLTCGSVHYGVCLPVKSKVIASSAIGAAQAAKPVLPTKRKINVPINIVKSSSNKNEKEITSTAVEKKEPVPSVTERKEPVPSVTERKEPVPSVTERKEPVPLVVEKKELVPPVIERKEPVLTPVERKEIRDSSLSNQKSEESESDLFLRQKKDKLDQKRELERKATKEREDALVRLQKNDISIESNVASPEVVSTRPSSPPATVLPAEDKDLGVTIDSKKSTNLVPSDTRVHSPLPSTLPSKPEAGDLSSSDIPQFYFPLGSAKEVADNEELLQNVKAVFDKAEGGNLTFQQMGDLMKACDMSFYWKSCLFRYLGGSETSSQITYQGFLNGWKRLSSTCRDKAAKFLCITARPGHNYLEFDDFLPLVQDVVDGHPGLTFLQDAPEFHSRYIQTVISRIFYCVNRSWSGRITVQEIRKSNLLRTIDLLEVEDDINQITDYFSYEHFYVIYCKFWELDKDHDLLISEIDLAQHNNHAISARMIRRIFSGAVTRNMVDFKMSYKDFVWFLISEEDKRHPTSIEYWFRCMDLDGDGIISMYEMEYFYEEQVTKMDILDIETLPFTDCLCQMLDMIGPKEEGKIRLRDLKACSLTPIFFDTFFNLEKYLRHEQKDPFASLRDGEDGEMSDWERYAAEEYEMLVAEEGGNELQQSEVSYDDDFEPEEHDSGESSGSERSVQPPTDDVTQLKKAEQLKGSTESKDDGLYDFSNTDDPVF